MRLISGYALMMRLVSDGPVRLPRPARRALTGKVSLAGGLSAGYESSLERDWLLALDFDWRVKQVLEQPYTLSYRCEGKRRRYTPDILAEFDDGFKRWTIVYEVKEVAQLQARWGEFKPRYKAALHDCRLRGWQFRLVTERDVRIPYIDNIKFLRRYRDIPPQKMHRDALLYSLRGLGEMTAQALLAATWWDPERRLQAIPELWRLVATRKIEAPLAVPLTMTTPLWLP